jgi:hypothetical protein
LDAIVLVPADLSRRACSYYVSGGGSGNAVENYFPGHNDEVYTALGKSAAQIAQLRSDGVI